MVIGFDAKHMLDGDDSALGLYGRLTVDALSEHYPQSDYILYTSSGGDDADSTASINHLLVHSSVHLKSPHTKSWAESEGKALKRSIRRHGVQVYHGLPDGFAESAAECGTPVVATVGELLHKRFPSGYSWTERFGINRSYRKALNNASAVVALSQFSRQEIIDSYGVSPDKVKVVMPVCEAVFDEQVTNEAKEAYRQRFGLPERYVLVSGDFTERSNMLKAVEAMAQLAHHGLGMVVIGHRNAYYQKFKALAAHLGVPGSIVRIRENSRAALPVVYAAAEAVVCPSVYECASLPIMRSLRCGTPVVAAKGSCMEEYGGDAALYFSPDNASELAQAITLATGSERARLLEAAKAQRELFTSKRLADQLSALYREVRHAHYQQ